MAIHLKHLFAELNASNQRIAIGHGTQEINYNDLHNKVKSIASQLNNVKSNRIGLYFDSSINAYASILACWFSGKSYVVLSPNYPTDRISVIMELANINCLIIENIDALEAIHTKPAEIICTTNLKTIHNTIQYSLPNLDDEAYVLFTSGTTGQPKGVPITHKCLANFVYAFHKLGYDLNQDDRFLQMFDLTFDLSIMSFLIPLTIGGSFYIIDKHKVKPIAIYEVLESKKITFALMVPSVIKTLEPYLRNETINGLKYSQFCGETLTVSQVESWQNICPNTEIDNVYGPTEATIYCTRYKIIKNSPIHHYNGIVSIGKPMYGTTLNVINDELLIGGAQVTSGYINENLNTTSFALIDNMRFYKSGDVAALNDTEFYCLGRLDRQVKIQGFRVELSEIEYTFGLLFPNYESVAIYIDFKNQGRIILCVLAHHTPLDINNVIAQLREKLPAYMVPEQIQIWGQWPLNSNGKIDIKQLSNEILNKTG